MVRIPEFFELRILLWGTLSLRKDASECRSVKSQQLHQQAASDFVPHQVDTRGKAFGKLVRGLANCGRETVILLHRNGAGLSSLTRKSC